VAEDEHVSFRLGRDLVARLESLAAERHVSRSELLRRLVVDSVSDVGAVREMDALDELIERRRARIAAEGNGPHAA
jgi:predicted transcriptional regulator